MAARAGSSVTAASRPPSVWHFGPDDAPVRVAGAEALLAHLPVFLGGWPLRRVAGPAPRCDVRVRTGPGGAIAVETLGPGGTVLDFDNEMDAANGLAGALVAEYVAARADTVCLHAGSALVGAGLCVLLGASLAGKSSVAMQLAASGYRLFGDDRLAVRQGDDDAPAEGTCLGLQPKLRLPLPEDAGPALEGFVESYTEIRTGTAAYLRPWDTEAATFGDTAPLGALVALERGGEDDPPATLEPAPRAEIARALLSNVFAAHITAETLVTEMAGLAGRVPGYRLRWTSSRAAARLLADALKTRPAG